MLRNRCRDYIREPGRRRGRREGGGGKGWREGIRGASVGHRGRRRVCHNL